MHFISLVRSPYAFLAIGLLLALAFAGARFLMDGGSTGAHAQQDRLEGGIYPICDPEFMGDERFCPESTGEVEDPTPGANSNVITSLQIPIGQYNFRAVVTFYPPEWGIATDEDIPNGAVVGELFSQATLGLLGGACNTALPVEFTFLDATTDPSETVEFADHFETMPDGLPRGVNEYPGYLARIFVDDDGPISPRARQYAQTAVAGTPVSLQNVIFNPGTPLFGGLVNPHPDMGYPSVSVLLNAGDPEAVPAPGPITNFCTPLVANTTIYGVTENNENTDEDESGHVFLTNPDEDMEALFTLFAASQWDTNQSGFENALDVCKHREADYTLADFDPRQNDGIAPPEVCGFDAWPTDPPDVDNDGYLDRQDNCPWVANGEDEDNQEDSNNDGVGDACYIEAGLDPTLPPEELGAITYVGCLYRTVAIGGGGDAPAELCDMAYDGPPVDEPGVDDDDGGLSTAAIVGIVVAVVAAVIILGGAVALMARRRA